MSGKYDCVRDSAATGDFDFLNDIIFAQAVSGGFAFDEAQTSITDVVGKLSEPCLLTAKAVIRGWLKCGLLLFSNINVDQIAGLVLYRGGDGMLLSYHDDFEIESGDGSLRAVVFDVSGGLFRF